MLVLLTLFSSKTRNKARYMFLLTLQETIHLIWSLIGMHHLNILDGGTSLRHLNIKVKRVIHLWFIPIAWKWDILLTSVMESLVFPVISSSQRCIIRRNVVLLSNLPCFPSSLPNFAVIYANHWLKNRFISWIRLRSLNKMLYMFTKVTMVAYASNSSVTCLLSFNSKP